MFIQFGSGRLAINPLNVPGSALAVNPTPRQLVTLADSSVEFAQDLKELKGQYQFADDVAPGDKKLTGKINIGRVDYDLFNNVFFADTRSTGTKQEVAESHPIVGTSPSAGTLTVTNSANFDTDLGVQYASNGQPFTRVATTPAQGQYTVTAGTYGFNAADDGLTVIVSYVYDAATSGYTIQVNNQLMGYGPQFELWLAEPYQQINGKNAGLHICAARMSKLSLPKKRDAYTMPEMEWTGFASPSGLVMEMFEIL